MSVCRAEPGVEKRIDALLGQMTLDEKILLVHGDSYFSAAGVSRLGIPARVMSDGPHGVREETGPHNWNSQNRADDYVTALPVASCLAATWNVDLARQAGEMLGREARARGRDILLMPGMNIVRTPLGGRNFEYLGEDPLLAGAIATAQVQGLQSQDVAASIKHFALNEQENQRMSINVEVDERALREIYLLPFEMCVRDGKALTVMGAYNKFRGQHACHNDYLLNQILKNEWGFTGLVMSDWGGTHDTRQAALNGLDLEMGTEKPYEQYFLSRAYRDAIERGELPTAGLDDKARRNLRVMFQTKMFEPDRKTGTLNTPDNRRVARRVAEEGIVLLKNDSDVLPLDGTKLKTIAVIGENATRPHAAGGFSSGVKAFREITPLEGIVQVVGKQVNVIHSPGYRKGADPSLEALALEAARKADVVIFCGGLAKEAGFDSETRDRSDMKMPWGQDDLIRKIIGVNPRTVVVLQGTIMDVEAWADAVPAIVHMWYGGSEGGVALANVLFGKVNPSGKLPMTFPRRLADSPPHALGAKAYPGVDGTVNYAEGLLVGYRWFDTKRIEPRFPFGHGLSYTSFAYANATITGSGTDIELSFDLTNTGSVAGAEVAQVYVRPVDSPVERLTQELKAFRKVSLAPGETKRVSVKLDSRAFAHYDPAAKAWVVAPSRFDIAVGGSSRGARLSATHSIEPSSR